MSLPHFADLPYLALRFIRRTCFPTAIPRAISALLPGFRSNCGTHSSASVVDLYDQYLLNILYDRRIRPGMTRTEVEALLPEVLPQVRAWVDDNNKR